MTFSSSAIEIAEIRIDEEESPRDPSKPSDNSTRHWIDFQKPADAEQLIGPEGSQLIPENPKLKSQWNFAEGILTASPNWDSVVTPGSYQDFIMHIEFNVNDAGEVEHERNGNSGIYLQLRYELQILNSCKVPFETYTKTDCGCIYGIKKPDQMACLPAFPYSTEPLSACGVRTSPHCRGRWLHLAGSASRPGSADGQSIRFWNCTSPPGRSKRFSLY